MSVLEEATKGSQQLSFENGEYLGAFFWNWYTDHYNDKIATVKLLFINVTVRVYHVHPLFVLLFGPGPEA